MILLLVLSITYSATLQEAYDEATPLDGFDKYIILDSDSIYYGGLGLYEGNTFIDGRGAVIDLEFGGGIWIYADEDYPCSLEIRYCTIMNGQYYGLSFGGTSIGNIEKSTTTDEINSEDQNQFLKIVKDITSKGFVRSNYKKNLVDLSDIKINLKGKK